MNAGFEITTLWTMYTINLSHENKSIECQVVSLVMKEGVMVVTVLHFLFSTEPSVSAGATHKPK